MPVSASMIGRTIGHYTIKERLGEGGMGTVYLAHDVRLGRDVALKVITPVPGHDAALASRLRHEARAASALNHPNIVTLHEIGEADGIDFIVMERVAGQSLAASIPPGGMPVAQVIDLARQIAGAVAAAHGAHIVHRDLKPANIMVTSGGRVKVLDFGLARSAPPALLDESTPTLATPTRLTGTGAVLGSIGYMSPEQIEGQPAFEPSDVFSLGVILFEMLTGRRPFVGDSDWAVLAATMQGSPPRVESLRPEARGELARIVHRCLARQPADRYPTGAELAEELETLATPRPIAEAEGKRRPRARAIATLAIALVAASAITVWFVVREARLRWARETAIAEVGTLTASGDLVGAYDVARRALAIAPHDFQVKQAWEHLVAPAQRIDSRPSGADIAIRSFIGGSTRWTSIGRTPVEEARVPFGLLRWRLTKPGYDTLEVGQGSVAVEFELAPVGTLPPGMVRVPRGSLLLERTGQDIELPEFSLDRSEVTNREFKRFVDAGGYRRREYWKETFIEDAKTIAWEQAMDRFRDATGRPGPSTWELGSYPEGQDDYPVGGVSWYEAAAYAAFAGRSLPTVYHWYRASGSQGIFSEIVNASNFSAKGPVPVRSFGGLGPFGTHDMAGNVKEWCWNEVEGKRYILGGGWNELVYSFHDEDAQSPFERQAAFGFRCMLQREPIAENLMTPLPAFGRSTSQLAPVGDDVFAAYRRLYEYDRMPLDARTEEVIDVNPVWREELVTIRAAYGDERLPLRLYVPKSGVVPRQAVVIFPGSNAMRAASSRDLSLRFSDFHIRAGRVLVYPIYQGTYERRIPGARGVNQIRDIMIQRAKDMRRTLDYLATRRDIDSTRIAYYGISLGGQLAPLFLAVEPRFRTGVVFSGGFETWEIAPECDPVNFAPRVRVPVIMVNGREDFDLPYESAQVPMFRMLGTPESQKRHVVLEGGHIPLRKDAAIRAMLDWLDERLGAVK